mmetsp:Transcript_51857/g.118150  ORF Transcript_51857/g.118150 Transcript_51857/m.118150 type:complete len:291 (-) Transcript_51857:69-941(-)
MGLETTHAPVVSRRPVGTAAPPGRTPFALALKLGQASFAACVLAREQGRVRAVLARWRFGPLVLRGAALVEPGPPGHRRHLVPVGQFSRGDHRRLQRRLLFPRTVRRGGGLGGVGAHFAISQAFQETLHLFGPKGVDDLVDPLKFRGEEWVGLGRDGELLSPVRLRGHRGRDRHVVRPVRLLRPGGPADHLLRALLALFRSPPHPPAAQPPAAWVTWMTWMTRSRPSPTAHSVAPGPAAQLRRSKLTSRSNWTRSIEEKGLGIGPGLDPRKPVAVVAKHFPSPPPFRLGR